MNDLVINNFFFNLIQMFSFKSISDHMFNGTVRCESIFVTFKCFINKNI